MHAETHWRVLVIHKNSLFAQAVERLLEGRTGLEVLDTDIAKEDLWKAMERLRPDVVIMDRDDPGINVTDLVSGLLRAWPPVRVVCISTSQPKVEVFGKWQTQATQIEELIDVIQR
ncbi:MAG: hypothetical protein HY664_05050 [Chloroflexi bacterium]|nr:hypothetical protein [Chloroflexota bacterium]